MISTFIRQINFTQTSLIFRREVPCQSIKRICVSPSKRFSWRPTLEDGIIPITDCAKAENHRIRMNLALSYRVLNQLSLNEGVCNHLTAMAPSKDDRSVQTMLVAPGNRCFAQVYMHRKH